MIGRRDAPEVVVVGNSKVRVQSPDGNIVFGPFSIPGGGFGGPPTIADFDGDGRPEFATAAKSYYAVFDLDCDVADFADQGCSDRGIRWRVENQDDSSNRTGSSVFDFQGDGRAEVVYSDECFVRVYDGTDGEVIFSQVRPSTTWYENPVIADVDGDVSAEIVVGINSRSASLCSRLTEGARHVDKLFSGQRCNEASDCVSGVCDEGLCRWRQ